MTLKRKVDFEILTRIDDKTDTLVTGQAVLCEKIAKLDETSKSNVKRITLLEKVVWIAIGGATVVVFVLKLVVK
jgi:cell division protein FtsL